MKQRSIREVAVAALEIAEANPDYVYETVSGGCRYIDPYTGEGSCLFGQALVRVYGKKVIPLIRDLDCEGMAISLVMARLEVTGIPYEHVTRLVDMGMARDEMTPLMRAMWSAQGEQDEGQPWSTCAVLLREGLTADLGGGS